MEPSLERPPRPDATELQEEYSQFLENNRTNCELAGMMEDQMRAVKMNVPMGFDDQLELIPDGHLADFVAMNCDPNDDDEFLRQREVA